MATWRGRVIGFPVSLLLLVLALVVMAAIVGCGGEATSTPRPVATPTSTPTKPPAGVTAQPTPTTQAGVFPKAGEGGVPASVAKLTVAVDSWGWDELNPIQTLGINFLNDSYNTFFLMRDENHNIVSGLAVEWSLSDEGFRATLHPNAKWQDGVPITAEDIKWNFEAMRGDYAPTWKGQLSAQRFKDDIADLQVIDPKHIFIKTKRPSPDFIAYYSGSGYHQVQMGPPHHLKKTGPDGYEEDPLGGGPYKVKEWKQGERMVMERWDDFWSDTPWYHKPQHRTLEVLQTPDAAARFALLKSRQVDMVVNVPYVVAKDIPRSETFGTRGINPNKGDLWTQTIGATGNMNIVYVNLIAAKDAQDKPKPEELKPFDDIRVREAMELAVDKVAISEKAHFGFTKPASGLWFSGAFGYRPELKVSSYNPTRAKELLKEAGYPNGFSTSIYYGPFGNSPGIKEWLESAASYWKAVGIEVKIFEIETNEFYTRFARFIEGQGMERKWRPLAVQTWGRQEHATVQINYGYHRTGSYNCCWDEKTEQLWVDLNSTTDEPKQLKLLAELEDHVLQNRWVMTMDEVSVVQGYTDRVLAHPTAPHASSFEQLWRVGLKN